MQYSILSRGDSQEAMTDWLSHYPKLPEVNNEYEIIRHDLQEINNRIRQDSVDTRDAKYYIDSHFGLELYRYFMNRPDFSMRIASDDGFWRYLSIVVVPNLVAQRWGKDNEEHYWRRNTRIWLRSVWWYVHMSWQGSYETTKELLECSHFSTDTILNFEERSGRNGLYISTCRLIMKYYALVDEKTVQRLSRGKLGNSDDLFRIVMKLNTAKLVVQDPSLSHGGEDEYVKNLFKEAGVVFPDC